MTALGRAGVPDDVGPMIAALLSDENRWVNGQKIEASGGRLSKLEVPARTTALARL
jgi:NAD(P)-dependent dehydrogenase (short-subunit alcohol dehydrogenase family)